MPFEDTVVAREEMTAQAASQAVIPNAFTVDVEDYYQVTAFERHVDRDQWSGFESRVERSTHVLLELLAKHNVLGTFYVLGAVAERHPHLVREIHAAGHEIGSHSHRHRLVYQQSPEQFRLDLRESLDVLMEITGEPVTAYRAPTFSITRVSQWALEILVEEGIQIDSSIFPVYHDRYGIPGAPRGIHRIQTAAGALWEFPPTVARLARYNLPVGGGGYFRLYPLAMTSFCLRNFIRQIRGPFMFYVHPWELDPEQPRLRVGTRLSRFRHYVNLASTGRKLDRLLRQFRFGRLRDIMASVSQRESTIQTSVSDLR